MMRGRDASGDSADDTARFSGQFLELDLRRARVVVLGMVVLVPLRSPGGGRAVGER